MAEFSVNQYDIMVNVFSLATVVMGVASVFFFLQRSEVLPRYRLGVTLLGITTLISAYSCYRLQVSWGEAFSVVNGTLKVSGVAFNEGYRYIDCLLTFPLLLIALVHTLDIPARQVRVLSTILAVLAGEMVVLGYPGVIATTAEARWLWWGIAMVPALIIVYQLYFGLSGAIAAEPAEAKRLARKARLLTVVSWAAYPVFYLLPLLGFGGSMTYTGTQVGYAVAGILSKVAYGVLLYRIAAAKSAQVDEVAHSLRTVRV